LHKKIAKALAFLMAVILILSFAGCGGKDEPTTQPDATQADATTEPSVSEEDSTTVTETSSEDSTTTKTETSTEQPKEPSVISGKSDIVNYFNDATAKAVSSKAGFKKIKTTTVNKLEMGNLAKFKIVRETIGKFLDEGTTTVNAAKGKDNSKELMKSVLKASDVKSAACTLSSDKKFYEIEMDLIEDPNPRKGSSPLGRVTKDFKTAKEISDGLVEGGASAKTVDEQIPRCEIEAKIDAYSGKLVSLTVSFDFNVQMTKVKYLFVTIDEGNGEASTLVKYTNFVW
jgi:predicted small lipoprotein YifL